MDSKSAVNKSIFYLWISHFFVDFFTGIWPIYKTVAQIDIAQAGLIFGITGFTGEILQPIFGYLCDRGHRKKMLIIGLCLASIILLIPLSTNLFFSFAVLLCLMVGSSAYHPAAAGMVPTLVSENKARTLLLFNSGGAAGFGFSQIIFCSLFFSCREYLNALMLLPCICVFFLILHRFPNQSSGSSFPRFKDFMQSLLKHRKALSFLYFSQVMYQGMRATFLFFLPEILKARCSNPWIWQGGGFLFFVLGSVLSMVPAGHLSDKYGQKKVLLYVVSGTICMFYLLIVSNNLPLGGCLVLLTLMGSLFGIINPLTIAWGHTLVPESPSTVSGLLMGLAWCVGNLTPAFAGLLHTHFSHGNDQLTLAIMGVLLIAVFFTLLATPVPQQKPLID